MKKENKNKKRVLIYDQFIDFLKNEEKIGFLNSKWQSAQGKKTKKKTKNAKTTRPMSKIRTLQKNKNFEKASETKKGLAIQK